ncbi:uncharacterized protein LOC132759429 [Ruditapes philippinarum]|uniref:uncharacterized protein LOC132759429 n=1 Tax=Ruditapes philippinarum TaxID=129788 RepID=UPI00295BB80F|nr:uncharacterized protein LOC132759429 [Ruditapes philippinarum]
MKRGDLSDDFEERVAKCIAETAQFPLEFCFVTTHTDMRSFCASSKDPAMICQLNSMYIFNDEANFDKYYTSLFTVLKETTRLPGKRILVELVACPDKMAKLGD